MPDNFLVRVVSVWTKIRGTGISDEKKKRLGNPYYFLLSYFHITHTCACWKTAAASLKDLG